jgi:hypothetical protein
VIPGGDPRLERLIDQLSGRVLDHFAKRPRPSGEYATVGRNTHRQRHRRAPERQQTPRPAVVGEQAVVVGHQDEAARVGRHVEDLRPHGDVRGFLDGSGPGHVHEGRTRAPLLGVKQSGTDEAEKGNGPGAGGGEAHQISLRGEMEV